MGKFKFAATVGILFFFVNYSFAQFQGCKRGVSIYTDPPNSIFAWTNSVSESCPSNATTSTEYSVFLGNVPSASTCYIGLFGLGGSGTLVYYRIANCPIDDYIWFFILPIGGFSFFYMRKTIECQIM